MQDLRRFDEFELDVLRRELRRNGHIVPLSGKPFDVLFALVERPGQVISKGDLLSTVWPDSFVGEANLTQSISVLRKALGETASGSRYIVTVPGRGYQLAVVPQIVQSAPPMVSSAGAHDPVPAKPPPPELPPPARRTPRAFLLWVGALLTALALGIAAAALWRATRPAPFSHISVRQLTNAGDLRTVAVAPSGRYVAWVSRNSAGQGSLSVSDLASGSSRVLLRTDHDIFEDLAFSPGEGFVYFRSHEKAASPRIDDEHRVPLLGGEPSLVLHDLDSPVTFLNNGKRICFARGQGADRLSFVTADADDGGDERVLATLNRPLSISTVCSPDGLHAVFSAEVGGLAMVDLRSGKETPFYDNPQEREIFGDVAWRADSRGLLLSTVTPFTSTSALAYLSYPGKRLTRITNDLDSYRFPGITNDGKTIVALRRDSGLEVRSIDLPLPGIAPETAGLRWSSFLGWWNDDTLVGTTADGSLKLTDIETGQERSLPTPHGMQFLQPSGCGQEGIVATGRRQPDGNLTVWFVRADGSGLRQLSHGSEDLLPRCTPDGKWVVYADNSLLKHAAMYRVPLGGGDPLRVGGDTVWFAVSFHTHQLAWVRNEPNNRYTLVTTDLDTGKEAHGIPLPAQFVPSRGLSWAPDDQHVFLIVSGGKADAIWRCNLDGSPPVKVVEVPGRQVGAVLVSPGGKRLGFLTAHAVSDAVAIQDLDR